MKERFCSSKRKLWMRKQRGCRMSSSISKHASPKLPRTVLLRRSTCPLLVHHQLMAAARNRQHTIKSTWRTSSFSRHCPCSSRAWPRRASRMSRSTTTRSPFSFTRIKTATPRPKKPFRRFSRQSPKPLRSGTARGRTRQQWMRPPLTAQPTSSSNQTTMAMVTTVSTDSEQCAKNLKLLPGFALLNEHAHTRAMRWSTVIIGRRNLSALWAKIAEKQIIYPNHR